MTAENTRPDSNVTTNPETSCEDGETTSSSRVLPPGSPGLSAGQTALVTGGGGFLGKALVRALVQRNLTVRSFSRKSYPELEQLGATCLTGEISDPAAVSAALKGCDIVFHVAAKAGIEEPYSEYVRINVTGTETVLAACFEHGVQRLVYTSSPSVVFDGNDICGANESLPYPTSYHAYYPKTKSMAERKVLAANTQRLATVALRPHLIWGPGDNHLAPRLIAAAKAGRLKQVGDNRNKADTIYIDNAVSAHLLAGERLAPGSIIAGKAYFITQGDPRPVWDVVNAILATADLPPVNKSISYRTARCIGALMEFVYKTFRLSGEPPMTRWLAGELATSHWFDITAAKRELAYEPTVSIEEGMARLKAWYRANHPQN